MSVTHGQNNRPVLIPWCSPQQTRQHNNPLQGGLVRCGARGALVGVAAGAIARDAGKDAGIGATIGALGGAMKQKDQKRQKNQAAEQQAATYSKNREGYTLAQSACLEGRGCSVK